MHSYSPCYGKQIIGHRLPLWKATHEAHEDMVGEYPEPHRDDYTYEQVLFHRSLQIQVGVHSRYRWKGKKNKTNGRAHERKSREGNTAPTNCLLPRTFLPPAWVPRSGHSVRADYAVFLRTKKESTLITLLFSSNKHEPRPHMLDINDRHDSIYPTTRRYYSERTVLMRKDGYALGSWVAYPHIPVMTAHANKRNCAS